MPITERNRLIAKGWGGGVVCSKAEKTWNVDVLDDKVIEAWEDKGEVKRDKKTRNEKSKKRKTACSHEATGRRRIAGKLEKSQGKRRNTQQQERANEKGQQRDRQAERNMR